MHKTVLAVACVLCWLLSSAQISSKKVFSFGGFPSTEHAMVKEKVNALTPFKLVGGLIFVEAMHDGHVSSYILDTGAPGLILNSKIDHIKKENIHVASGLTGNTRIGEYNINEFKILNITKRDFQAFQMDLEHIEDEILHRFSGLVGGDMFDNTILILDYQKQLWGTVNKIKSRKIACSIAFTQQEHFIIVEIELAGEKMRMILDTGAEISLLDEASMHQIRKSALKKAGSTSIQSASRDNRATQNVNAHKFHMQKHVEKHHEFSVLDFNFINEGLDEKINGLIGFPFFKDKKIGFDFPNGLIHIYK